MVLLHTIGNPSRPLRQTGGTSVAVIVGVGGLENWPELLAAFASCLESNDKNSLEGALDALYKVCSLCHNVFADKWPTSAYLPLRTMASKRRQQSPVNMLATGEVGSGSVTCLQISEDVPGQLEAEVSGRRCIDELVPRLLALFKSQHQEAKCLAVAIMNILAIRMPAALAENLDE